MKRPAPDVHPSRDTGTSGAVSYRSSSLASIDLDADSSAARLAVSRSSRDALARFFSLAYESRAER